MAKNATVFEGRFKVNKPIFEKAVKFVILQPVQLFLPLLFQHLTIV